KALAIHEKVRAAVEELALPVQADDAGAARAAGLEHHLRLRHGQVLAKERNDVAAAPANAPERTRGKIDHPGRYLRAAARRAQAPIAVARIGKAAFVQPVEECRAELRAARRAKADGIREARLERHAVMAHARGQIDQVAGTGKYGSAAVEAPAAPPASLYEEHVVRIDVRADAAAQRGVARHDIVEPRLRQERKAPQQRVGALMVKIHSAHEQGPIARPRPQARERAVARLIASAAAHHDARLDVVAAREGQQIRGVEQIPELRQRAAHIERTLLPMPSQEFARRQAAEQTKLHARDYM